MCVSPALINLHLVRGLCRMFLVNLVFNHIKPPFIEDVPVFFSVLGALRAGQVWWMAASRAASLPRLSQTS